MTMFNITDGKNDISRDKPVSPVRANLGRLLRVVLPVKRDCSADNPNSPGDYILFLRA